MLEHCLLGLGLGATGVGLVRYLTRSIFRVI
jgi:hypothetical protein